MHIENYPEFVHISVQTIHP